MQVQFPGRVPEPELGKCPGRIWEGTGYPGGTPGGVRRGIGVFPRQQTDHGGVDKARLHPPTGL